MIETETIADQIRDLCAEREISVWKLAEDWGVPYNTLRDWASGDHEPRGFARKMLLNRLKRCS